MLLLIVSISFTAAELTWRLVHVDKPASITPATDPVSLKSSRSRVNDYSGLSSLHLFGQAQRIAEPKPISPVFAPKTNLRLFLRGIFLSENAASNIAIIADSSERERPYRIGDTISENVSIEQILPHRVLLKRGGRLEALDLPNERVENSVQSNRPINGAAVRESVLVQRPIKHSRAGKVDMVGTQPSSEGSAFGRVPKKILTNPTEIAKHLKLDPVNVDGQLKGYRVGPRSKSDLFRDTGLIDGDVVTRINGIALNNPNGLGELIQQLNTADHFMLDVENGNRQRSVNVRVD